MLTALGKYRKPTHGTSRSGPSIARVAAGTARLDHHYAARTCAAGWAVQLAVHRQHVRRRLHGRAGPAAVIDAVDGGARQPTGGMISNVQTDGHDAR